MYILPCELWDEIYQIFETNKDHISCRTLRRLFKYMWIEHPLKKPLKKSYLIKNGHVNILEKNEILKYNRKDVLLAIQHEQINVLRYFDHLGLLNRPSLLDYSAEKGKLISFQYLEKKKWKIDLSTLNYVAGNGHIDLVSYIDHNYNMRPDQYGYTFALRNGHIPMIIYMETMYDGNFIITREDVDECAKKGLLNMVLYLEKRGFHPSSLIINEVAYNGHLEMLKYLETRYGYKCTEAALQITAFNGYLPIMKHLENQGFSYSASTINIVASRGHLDVIKHLESLGYQINIISYYNAIENGYLNIVIYAEDNYSFVPNLESIDKTCGNGNYKIVKHVYIKHCMAPTQYGLDLAVSKGSIKTVKYIERITNLKISLVGVMFATTYKRKEMVQYLMRKSIIKSSSFSPLSSP